MVKQLCRLILLGVLVALIAAACAKVPMPDFSQQDTVEPLR